MRSTIWLLILLTGCVVPGVCPVDEDFDGVCDAEDPCPGDSLNDGDGDGVCDATADRCIGFDDGADEDADGVPDGCDDCPGDDLNDADEDGVCGADDPCPDDADDACDVTVTIAVQTDAFPEEASWSLTDSRGSQITKGDFDEIGGGGFFKADVSATTTSCLTLRDAEGDGGTRALVFRRPAKLRLGEVDADDYTTSTNLCFTPTEGDRDNDLPREPDWLAGFACTLDVDIATGFFGSEIGWQLETPDGKVLEEQPIGTYVDDLDGGGTTLTTSVDVVSGSYVLRLFDSFGDGWDGNGDTAGFTLSIQGGPTLLDNTFRNDGPSSFEATFEFDLDCG